MNSPENRPGMTRRELIKRASLIGIAIGSALLLTEGATWGVINHVEKSRRLKELEASLYFERLKNAILEIQTGKDRGSELRRSIYLGNVNDFDREKTIVSRGPSTITTTTGPTTITTFDLITGKQTTETIGQEKETTEFQFNIPEFITDVTRDKKSDIKILYLNSGKNHPFKGSFQKTGDTVQGGVRELLPGIDVNVVNQETVLWDPDARVYFNGVTGDIEEDKVQNGKFRLSNKYRYLLFTEQPLLTYDGTRFDPHDDAKGTSMLHNNIAVVNLFNYEAEADPSRIIKTALQEIGHSYGMDHCWEDNCAMSYKVALGYAPYILPTSYGPRCLMIGTNIAGGHIEEVRNQQNPKAYFASAQLATEDIARQNFEEHLVGYLSDIAGKIPAGVKLHSTVGKNEDIVTFSMHNRNLAIMSVKEFISSIITV